MPGRSPFVAGLFIAFTWGVGEAVVAQSRTWTSEEIQELVYALNTNDKSYFDQLKASIDGIESVDLRSVNLSGQTLTNVSVLAEIGAVVHLDYAVFDEAELNNVDLSRAHLSNVSAKGVVLSGGTTFDYARLDHVDFGESNRSDAPMIADVSFLQARLNNVRFRGTLSNVNFLYTTCKGCDFSYVEFSELNFGNAQLERVDFYQAQGVGLFFPGARLSDTSFKESVFINGGFDGAELQDLDFSNSQITETTFVGARISVPKMAGWDFEHLDFRYLLWPNGAKLDDKTEHGPTAARTRHWKLERRQQQNSYTLLAEKYAGYGYHDLAQQFHVYERRVARSLKENGLARFFDWMLHDVTHGYGGAPGRLFGCIAVLILGFAAFYSVLGLLNVRWCGIQKAEMEDSEQTEAYLTRAEQRSVKGVLVNSLFCSWQMFFFPLGRFLKIPQMVTLLRLQDINYKPVSYARIACFVEAMSGLWITYLAVTDLLAVLNV